MEVSHSVLVRWLRAAGEPSRLRLLALCGEGALSVSDLARALEQSEPRVSRHLKILCEAGLIERVRQGQWVHYRLSTRLEAMSFVRGVLAQLTPRDALLVRDRAASKAAQGAPSRLGRALAEFASGTGCAAPLNSLLLSSTNHPELLELAAGAGSEVTVIAESARAAQAAASLARPYGVTCRVVRSLKAAQAYAPYEAVILDESAAADQAAPRLAAAQALLASAGRLWLFEPYEAFEKGRGRVVEHPLAKLRRLLGEAGLTCERLGPIEADGEHVLACVSTLTAASAAAGGSR
jgi:DNA-binding transcriptional ArsR family regulator